MEWRCGVLILCFSIVFVLCFSTVVEYCGWHAALRMVFLLCLELRFSAMFQYDVLVLCFGIMFQ